MRISAGSQTDWDRLDAMDDEDIELSDIPEVTPEMFARAVARKGLKPIERKKQVAAQIDAWADELAAGAEPCR